MITIKEFMIQKLSPFSKMKLN